MKRWTQFIRAEYKPNPQISDELMKKFIANGILSDEVYINSRYQVSITRQLPKGEGPELVHLSIKTLDKTAVHDWRDFQRIKNELIGPEEEAIELYPAESRLVDTSNQYHLWCFKGVKWPIGFNERLVSEKGDPMGSVQRPFEDDNRPTDLVYVDMNMIDKLSDEVKK